LDLAEFGGGGDGSVLGDFGGGAVLAPVAGLGDVVVGEGDVAEELFQVAEGAGVGDGAKEELDGGVGED
jgi:hypothetical protein